VKTIEVLRNSANESCLPAAFVNGYTDGQAARNNDARLTAYLRVGIDDYAKGFRAGFFARGSALVAAERPIGRHAVNL
jgi:hypothetical protein